jgi:DNA primase
MCFGCGESGNVITFVTKHDHMSFPEAVEHLARRYGVDLQFEEGGQAARSTTSQRTRLLQAHQVAAAFYVEQLGSPEAAVARQFLAERGFDQAAARDYGVGFSPAGWDTLTKHLQGKGFTREELIAAGLSGQSSKGSLIDKFRYRLMWPIHDIGGEVIGFGARKL